MRSSIIPLLAALLAVACATPPPIDNAGVSSPRDRGVPTSQGADSRIEGIHFTAEMQSDRTVLLQLDNGTRETIGYNLCASVLERRDGDSWSAGEADVCTMQLLTLNPGSDATYKKKPASLTPGTYRYTTRVESPLGTAPAPISTPPFDVW